MSTRRLFTALSLAVTVGLPGIAAVPATAAPATAPAGIIAPDPAPTATSITRDGTYTWRTTRIDRAEAVGFGGGTIWQPTNGLPGQTFPAVVVVPGFFDTADNFALFGRRLASHGFIVLTADVNSIVDLPTARAQAIEAATRALLDHPAVQGRIDKDHVGLVGHSMGGGGVLTAAATMDVDAVLALHPWCEKGRCDFGAVTEPTMVVGGTIDASAPYRTYQLPIYASLTHTREKGLLTRIGGTHLAALVDDPVIQGRNLAFLKTFVAHDERYREFWCAPALPRTEFVSTCRTS